MSKALKGKTIHRITLRSFSFSPPPLQRLFWQNELVTFTATHHEEFETSVFRVSIHVYTDADEASVKNVHLLPWVPIMQQV